jgi:acetyl esterase/lipase
LQANRNKVVISMAAAVTSGSGLREIRARPMSRGYRLRGWDGAIAEMFRSLAWLGGLHPMARPERHGVRKIEDASYGPEPWQRLDWYVPPGDGPWPVVVYVHGGAFQALDKGTHWVMGLALARAGYLTAIPDYRLAPAHPYPAGLVDTLDAVTFVHAAAAELGGRSDRLALAGESAGACYAVAAAIAATDPPAEDFALAFRARGISIAAVLAWCGVYELVRSDRWAKTGRSRIAAMRLREIEKNMIATEAARTSLLCNPLLYFESGTTPLAFPPTYLASGERDVVLDDTLRLGEAMRRRGVLVEERIYARAVHAFHAFVMSAAAKQSWKDAYVFLARHLGESRDTGAAP